MRQVSVANAMWFQQMPSYVVTWIKQWLQRSNGQAEKSNLGHGQESEKMFLASTSHMIKIQQKRLRQSQRWRQTVSWRSSRACALFNPYCGGAVSWPTWQEVKIPLHHPSIITACCLSAQVSWNSLRFLRGSSASKGSTVTDSWPWIKEDGSMPL